MVRLILKEGKLETRGHALLKLLRQGIAWHAYAKHSRLRRIHALLPLLGLRLTSVLNNIDAKIIRYVEISF